MKHRRYNNVQLSLSFHAVCHFRQPWKCHRAVNQCTTDSQSPQESSLWVHLCTAGWNQTFFFLTFTKEWKTILDYIRRPSSVYKKHTESFCSPATAGTIYNLCGKNSFLLVLFVLFPGCLLLLSFYCFNLPNVNRNQFFLSHHNIIVRLTFLGNKLELVP